MGEYDKKAAATDQQPSALAVDAAPDAAAARAQSAELTGAAATDMSATTAQAREVGAATAATPAPKPAGPPELTAGDVVVSRDAAYTSAGFVTWFADQIKAIITGWGLAFDPATVFLANETKGAAKTPVIALKWDAAWGAQPTQSTPGFDFGPVDASAARKTVTALKGWATLTAAEKAQVEPLLFGATNAVSVAARGHLRTIFSGLAAKTEAQQKASLTGLVGSQDAMPSVVSEQVETAAATYTLGAAATVKDYAFRGKKADAEKTIATYDDGKAIDIFAPKAPYAKGVHQHTVAEAADAAAYLPKPSRAVLTKIVLNVQENPDDAHWAVEYKDPNFHSYMTASPSGEVTIYPDSKAQPGDNYRRGTMIHETGHTWSYKAWGTDTSKGKWVTWKAAMTKDGNAVSDYAQASIAEDVAETIQIFGSMKGTPKYDEYKAMVPNRFKILEAEMK